MSEAGRHHHRCGRHRRRPESGLHRQSHDRRGHSRRRPQWARRWVATPLTQHLPRDSVSTMTCRCSRPSGPTSRTGLLGGAFRGRDQHQGSARPATSRPSATSSTTTKTAAGPGTCSAARTDFDRMSVYPGRRPRRQVLTADGIVLLAMSLESQLALTPWLRSHSTDATLYLDVQEDYLEGNRDGIAPDDLLLRRLPAQ